MAITYNLSTDLGKLRLTIGDTVESSGPRPNGVNFSDDELGYFLDISPSVGAASVLVFDTLAAEWSKVTNLTLGPRKEELARIAEAFAKRATLARAQFGSGTAFSVSWDRVDGYSEASDTESAQL